MCRNDSDSENVWCCRVLCVLLIAFYFSASILQVSIACPERMEPITKVSHIPPSRWSLICSLCKLKTGACIQVSYSFCFMP